jgi:hypothetical protein
MAFGNEPRVSDYKGKGYEHIASESDWQLDYLEYIFKVK